jgi:hypothetical protein
MQKVTKERSTIFQSGILMPVPQIAGFLRAGGRTINMPFFKDLTDSGSDVGSDDPDDYSIPEKIATGRDQAVRQVRTKSWSAARLVASLAGADPMRAIANLVGDWWLRNFQDILIASLHGVYLDNVANDAGDMVRNIGTDTNSTPGAAELISADAVLDAKQTMGDAAEDLAVIIMHSVVYTRLQKQNLIDFIPDARGEIQFPTYLGYRVVVSDKVKTVAGTYRTYYFTYLIGRDAIGFEEQPLAESPTVEIHREPLQGGGVGVDVLITRRQYVLHPLGFAWTDQYCAGLFPSNTELALAANWNRVISERKQSAIAFLVTNG